jgi:tellurite resistance protein TerC
MITAGTVALARYHWLIYPLAALLAYTGVKILVTREESDDPNEENFAVRLTRRFLPVRRCETGGDFFVRVSAGWAITPTCLALVGVVRSDVLFAIDSVPAVLAVTIDPFLRTSWQSWV